MLAKRGIMWESEEHLRFADDVFERINRHAIEASCQLAEERGAYEKFEGSDWQTGAYFEKRGYTSPAWRELASRVAARGMRNAYLLAVAPTSSTSIVAGTTAGLDPVMRKFFLRGEEGLHAAARGTRARPRPGGTLQAGAHDRPDVEHAPRACDSATLTRRSR